MDNIRLLWLCVEPGNEFVQAFLLIARVTFEHGNSHVLESVSFGGARLPRSHFKQGRAVEKF